jgi:hypothetical protein
VRSTRVFHIFGNELATPTGTLQSEGLNRLPVLTLSGVFTGDCARGSATRIRLFLWFLDCRLKDAGYFGTARVLLPLAGKLAEYPPDMPRGPLKLP